MAKFKRESYFWTSFSDLMTSLFFVMLVLFVLTVALLHKKLVEMEQERNASQAQLDKIEEIEESIKNINSQYFEYDSIYKRHTLRNISVSFKKYSFNINDIPTSQRDKLLEVGLLIKGFVDSTEIDYPDVKYLLIIEGQSSKDDYFINDYRNNDVLSYQRALALYKYWRDNQIRFNGDNCEAIISGSGQNSQFRLHPDDRYNTANQRFVIHIIPKPGLIEASKQKIP